MYNSTLQNIQKTLSRSDKLASQPRVTERLAIGMLSKNVLSAPSAVVHASIPYLSTNGHTLPHNCSKSLFELNAGPIRIKLPGNRNAVSALVESGDQNGVDTHDVNSFCDSLLPNCFRCGIWIDDIQIHLDPMGRACGVEAEVGYACGSTPLRVSVVYPKLSSQACIMLSGEADHDWGIEPYAVEGPHAFLVSIFVQFRLSALADALQWSLVGHAAPWAWVQLDCLLQRDEGVSAALYSCSGSCVPSQDLFIAGQNHLSHDMLTLQAVELDGFIGGGPPAGSILKLYEKHEHGSTLAPRRIRPKQAFKVNLY